MVDFANLIPLSRFGRLLSKLEDRTRQTLGTFPLISASTETICRIILTIFSPFDILPNREVRRSLVGLLDFKSSVGG